MKLAERLAEVAKNVNAGQYREFVSHVILPIVARHERDSRDEALEEAAKLVEGFAGQWVNSLPIDERESLNCKQYAKAIRSLKSRP